MRYLLLAAMAALFAADALADWENDTWESGKKKGRLSHECSDSRV